jgi:hypothetical protein
MIDLYLSDKYYSHWPDIQKLAMSDEPDAFDKLKKYALEGYVSRFQILPCKKHCLQATASASQLQHLGYSERSLQTKQI